MIEPAVDLPRSGAADEHPVSIRRPFVEVHSVGPKNKPGASAWEQIAVRAVGSRQVSEVDDQPWGKFVYFADPDGNTWSLQEIVRPG